MWIKICGNTRLEDCQRAAELGADAVGFVFAEGKRTITPQQVADITPKLPPALEKIGVFTSREPSEIIHFALGAGLTGVQLHGPYDPALAWAVRRQLSYRPMFRLIQVLHWDADSPAAEQVDGFASACRVADASPRLNALLIDSRTQQGSGGTGMPFDWIAAKPALEGLRLPVIVAGGLRAENVAEAVRTLQPFGVDVASGVEFAPGVKDPERIARFIRNARSA